MNTNYINVSGFDSAVVVSYYEKLRKRIYSIIYYLEKSVSSLDEIDEVLVKYYSIDDSLVDNVNVKLTSEKINDRIRYLKRTIIPAINSKINSLK